MLDIPCWRRTWLLGVCSYQLCCSFTSGLTIKSKTSLVSSVDKRHSSWSLSIKTLPDLRWASKQKPGQIPSTFIFSLIFFSSQCTFSFTCSKAQEARVVFRIGSYHYMLLLRHVLMTCPLGTVRLHIVHMQPFSILKDLYLFECLKVNSSGCMHTGLANKLQP